MSDLQSHCSPNGPPLHWIRRQCKTAIAAGLDFDELLADVISRPIRDREDFALTSTEYALLLVKVVTTLEDELYGLAKRPQKLGSGALGLRMMLTFPNLESALNGLDRYFSLASLGMHIGLKRDRQIARVSLTLDARVSSDAPYVEDAWTLWLCMIVSLFVGHRIPLLSVGTTSPLHPQLGASHWIIGAPVRLTRVTCIEFSASYLSSPCKAPQQCERPSIEAARVWVSGSLTSTEREQLPERSGPRLSDFALHDGDSLSSVSRRLKKHGGFRALRKSEIMSSAIELLNDRTLSVEEVSATLGYADSRSFRRFLQGVTGFTPSQLRRQGVPSGAFQEMRGQAEIEATQSRILELMLRVDA